MRKFIKNVSKQNLLCCRIQINSKMLPQTEYISHTVKLKIKPQYLFIPGEEYLLELCCSSSDNIFVSNSRSFYFVKTNDYIDIYFVPPKAFSDYLLEVETLQPNSVTMFMEESDNTTYTRIDFFSNAILKGTTYIFQPASTKISFNVRSLALVNMTGNTNEVVIINGADFTGDKENVSVTPIVKYEQTIGYRVDINKPENKGIFIQTN